MYYDEIINLSYEQTINLTDFVKILKQLQSSIVKNDVDEIELTIEKEEKVLHKIKHCEEKRADAVKAALNHYQIEADKNEALDKLADVLLAIDPEVYTEYNEVRASLLEKVKEVLLLNQQNEIIISNSRKFIRDLIKSVLGSKKENFFDRKI